MRRLALALLIAVCGCTPPAEPTTPPAGGAAAAPAEAQGTAETPAPLAEPTVIFLVRHAEKADDGTRNPPLTEAGAVRADCLARTLGDAGVSRVFSTDLQRTQLTVEPLAKAMGLKVEALPAADGAALLEQLDGLPPGSVAIAAGHSNTVPAIARELGVTLTQLDEKGFFPHDEYDRLVAIVRAPNLPTTLLQLHYCAPSAPAK